MRRCLAPVLIVLALLGTAPAAQARETAAERKANVYAAGELAQAPPLGNLPDYSLSADKLRTARHLHTIRQVTEIGGSVWSILQLALLLWLGIIAWVRRRALMAGAGMRKTGKPSRAFWSECAIFTLLFALLTAACDLPLSLYGHHLGLLYGLSVQGWGSWTVDQLKALLLNLVGSLLFFALIIWLMRRLPRAWWFVCWLVVMPVTVGLIFISPYVLDPLFNKFEPLGQSHPELVARLEQVVARGHMHIPPERMFLMKASAKVTTLNAYVTGFGSSKRVVVWDTSLEKGSPDQILFIFGHESGHYVLGHILRGMLMAFFGLLLAFYLGYRFIGWSLRRFGAAWGVPAQGDWGTIPVLFLAFAILSVLSQPLLNGLSRMQEHAADVYGQEAIHGLVSDPQESARGAFAVLGEGSLDVPNFSPLAEFWWENHPAVGRRAAFAHAYDPWAPGSVPKYFPAPSAPSR